MIDDKFTEGIWYDTMTGDFCRIVETEDSIGLVEPDRPDADPFHEFDDPKDFDGGEYLRVNEEAVENPADVVREYAELLASGGFDGMRELPWTQAISLRWALRNVEITEA